MHGQIESFAITDHRLHFLAEMTDAKHDVIDAMSARPFELMENKRSPGHANKRFWNRLSQRTKPCREPAGENGHWQHAKLERSWCLRSRSGTSLPEGRSAPCNVATWLGPLHKTSKTRRRLLPLVFRQLRHCSSRVCTTRRSDGCWRHRSGAF